MKRIKMEVAYDGTDYHGWQIQDNGITVEEVINNALTELLSEYIEVIGASRTDAGVHALGNVAVFDTNSRIPATKICYALNQKLPKDITIQSSCEVAPCFHPRYQNSQKTYLYKILNRKFNLPTLQRYSHFVYIPLNIEKMRIAASFLIGKKDFVSFCSPRAQVKSTIRTITALDIDKEDDLITIRIQGNGFLYHMVRIIAGTLILVGRGKWEPDQVKKALAASDRVAAGPTAPAHGLTLEKIQYDDSSKESW